MAHVWNEQYQALYDRTYRVLYDAGINEKLADKLAAQRTLAAALMSREQLFPGLIHPSVNPQQRPLHTPVVQRDSS
jgi:hypothetical protein